MFQVHLDKISLGLPLALLQRTIVGGSAASLELLIPNPSITALLIK